MNIIPEAVKAYAREDLDAAIKAANENLNTNMSYSNIEFDRSSMHDNSINPDTGKEEYTISATAIIKCPEIDKQFEFIMEYVVVDEDVYGDTVDGLVDSLKYHYEESEKGNDGDPIGASTTINKSPIFAADGDDIRSSDFGDDEGEFEVPEDDDISDTLDDLSDTVDDIQDSIEDIQEDDVDIELENNIANHYIAECDKCHGVFISALVESDQEVEKISGTCPLCDAETDQYLKWIVKEV